jgi:hypothetical protein
VAHERRFAMNTIYTVVVTVFVLGVLSVVAYALFKMSPFAKHEDHYRDPSTGERQWGDSPHLETWHEFDQREPNST